MNITLHSVEDKLRKSKCVAVGLLLLFMSLNAEAFLVGSFLGLSKLIDAADAIVILRIDSHPPDFNNPTPFSTHECFIYQTLKGDIPKDSVIKIKLRDTELNMVTPYTQGSIHLMFLVKQQIENEPVKYWTLSIQGANTLLSPLGQEKMPEGATIEEQVSNLIKEAAVYQTDEYWKKQRILSGMLNYKEDTRNRPDDYDQETEEPLLVWRDSQTKKVIFTSDDIISFDWEKQVFLLKLDAEIDFVAWISSPLGGVRGLFVEDSQGVIYQGCWVHWASSYGCSNPMYRDPLYKPYYSITNRFALEKDSTNDIRFDPRLKENLKNANKLWPIDTSEYRSWLSLNTINSEQGKVGKDLQVRLEIYENTFQIGRMARTHLFFYGGEKTKQQVDSLFCIITLTANDGAFRSETFTDAVPISEIEDGFYECKFDPYQPEAGSDAKIKSYGGLVSLAVVFLKKGHIVYRLDFPEKTVSIKDAY
jgi:hypothetical protein